MHSEKEPLLSAKDKTDEECANGLYQRYTTPKDSLQKKTKTTDEEDHDLLKEKIKTLKTENLFLMLTILFILLTALVYTCKMFCSYQDADLIFIDLNKKKTNYPFIVLDENTDPDMLLTRPIQSFDVFQKHQPKDNANSLAYFFAQ